MGVLFRDRLKRSEGVEGSEAAEQSVRESERFNGLRLKQVETFRELSLAKSPSSERAPIAFLRGERVSRRDVVFAVENPEGGAAPGAPSFYAARVGASFLVFHNPRDRRLGPITDLQVSKVRCHSLPGGAAICSVWRIESRAGGELIDRVLVRCCEKGAPRELEHEVAHGFPLCPRLRMPIQERAS